MKTTLTSRTKFCKFLKNFIFKSSPYDQMFAAAAQNLGSACKQPFSLTILSVEAGFLTKDLAERVGRIVKSPPQFGQVPCRIFRAQSIQNVHSNEQINASPESGVKFLAQHSQNCRISNISLFLFSLISGQNVRLTFIILIKIGMMKRANFD